MPLAMNKIEFRDLRKYFQNFMQRCPNMDVESNTFYIFWICVSSLNKPAYKTLTPCYIIICSVSESTTFFILSHAWHNFQNGTFKYKLSFLISSTNWFGNFLFLRRIRCKVAIYIYIYTHFSMYVIYPIHLPEFSKRWSFSTFFVKFWNNVF